MLTVDNTEIDLGTIQFGKVYEFEYTLTNTVGKDMVINSLKPSCSSCTKASITKKIKGNDSAKMKVTYTPGAVGKALKSIDILYDGDQYLKVTFKAMVNG